PEQSLRRDIRASAPNQSSRFWPPIALALCIIAIFAVYWPAMHGGRLVDDNINITPPELRSASGLYRIWFDPSSTAQYYPLLQSVFWLEHKTWGDALLGYHLINVIWHSIASLLVYLVLSRLDLPGALLSAAIFAVHPVMVESVAWMSEQKNTLSTIFYLCAM